MRKDGGFIIAAESVYTSSRNGANKITWTSTRLVFDFHDLIITPCISKTVYYS